MGIPVIRSVAAEAPGVAAAALRDVPEPAAVAVADVPHDDPAADPVPGPSPRIADTFLQDDDEVVVMEPTPTRSFPVVAAPVASGPRVFIAAMFWPSSWPKPCSLWQASQVFVKICLPRSASPLASSTNF